MRALTEPEAAALAVVALGGPTEASRVARALYGREDLGTAGAAARLLDRLFWLGLLDLTADRPTRIWRATVYGRRELREGRAAPIMRAALGLLR